MDEQLKSNLVTFACTALITWIVKSFYDNLFKIRPRVYITLENILFSQMNINYMRFDLKWYPKFVIKNNSKYTAENIQLISTIGKELSDVSASKLLAPNNHLDSYQQINLETTLSLSIPYEEMVETFIEEDGTRVSLPGTKVPEPKEFFKPEGLKNIFFILKYKSESDKSFYTLYRRKNGIETNKMFKFNPMYIKRLYL